MRIIDRFRVRRAERMNSPQQPHEVPLRGLLCGVGVLLAVVAAIGMSGGGVEAQTQLQVPPAVEAVAHDAMTRLRSPITPSHTLDMCPAAEAMALRDTIRMAALQGTSADRIVEDVIARYGEQVRLIPRRSGFGLAAWLLTPMALLVGGLFLAMRVRAMRRSGPAPALAGGAAALSRDDQDALERALRDFERREDDA
jgi:cytochrome c-type biogenesis protein CcmH/NrfF